MMKIIFKTLMIFAIMAISLLVTNSCKKNIDPLNDYYIFEGEWAPPKGVFGAGNIIFTVVTFAEPVYMISHPYPIGSDTSIHWGNIEMGRFIINEEKTIITMINEETNEHQEKFYKFFGRNKDTLQLDSWKYTKIIE